MGLGTSNISIMAQKLPPFDSNKGGLWRQGPRRLHDRFRATHPPGADGNEGQGAPIPKASIE